MLLNQRSPFKWRWHWCQVEQEENMLFWLARGGSAVWGNCCIVNSLIDILTHSDFSWQVTIPCQSLTFVSKDAILAEVQEIRTWEADFYSLVRIHCSSLTRLPNSLTVTLFLDLTTSHLFSFLYSLCNCLKHLLLANTLPFVQQDDIWQKGLLPLSMCCGGVCYLVFYYCKKCTIKSSWRMKWIILVYDFRGFYLW